MRGNSLRPLKKKTHTRTAPRWVFLRPLFGSVYGMHPPSPLNQLHHHPYSRVLSGGFSFSGGCPLTTSEPPAPPPKKHQPALCRATAGALCGTWDPRRSGTPSAARWGGPSGCVGGSGRRMEWYEGTGEEIVGEIDSRERSFGETMTFRVPQKNGYFF